MTAISFFPDRLEAFVGNASELWMAGRTLSSLLWAQGFLEERVRAGTSMKFVVLHPELSARSAVIREIVSRRRSSLRDIKRELQATLRFLLQLEGVSDNPEQIQAWGYREVSTLAVTIVNPKRQDARARATIYLHGFLHRVDPILDFSKEVVAEAPYVDAMTAHVQSLMAVSEHLF